MRLSVFTFLFALIAAFHTVLPIEAEAASALFRVKRSWIGGDPASTTTVSNRYVSPDYHPRTIGPSSAPPGTAYIASGTMGGNTFTIPSSIIKDIGGTRTCFPFGCTTWLNSKVSNSYWNVKGSFRPNNPYGASTPTTIVFPTTMGNPAPPFASGDPLTPTTTFSGRYDYGRTGAIRITPGANRFGGTMKLLNGLGQRSYKYVRGAAMRDWYKLDRYYLYSSSQPTEMHQTRPGDFAAGPHGDGYYARHYGGLSDPRTVTRHFPLQAISTVAPWTTGQLTVTAYVQHHPLWDTTWLYPIHMTVSAAGYDNRTPNGLNGVISMVRPRLVHTYGSSRGTWSFAEIWQIDIHFLPEPGSSVLLITGVATLCGLCQLRRRWSKPSIVSAYRDTKPTERSEGAPMRAAGPTIERRIST